MNREERRAYNRSRQRYRDQLVATWDENGIIDPNYVLPPQRGIIISEHQVGPGKEYASNEEAAAAICEFVEEKLEENAT